MWAAALVAGWAVLAFANGGLDLGVDPVAEQLRGPTATALAAVPLVALAAWAVLGGGLATLTATRAGRLLLGGGAGLVAWSALSILWASAPDLAWIEVNRGVLAVCALVAAAHAATRWPGRWGPGAMALAVSAGVAPAVLWALATKAFPGLPGADSAARLHTPFTLSNVLAIVAVAGVPGALRWAAGADRRGRRSATALVSLAIVVTLLSYSRSGLLALVVAVGLMVGLGPRRGRLTVTALAAGLAAVPASAYGLTAHALTTDGLSDAARRGPGLLLALLVLGGALLAGPLADALGAWLDRADPVLVRRLWTGAAAALAVVVVAGAVVAVRGLGSDAAIGDTPGHVVSLSTNNRTAWWGEALRGAASAPLIGHGAGSFPVTHIAERAATDPSLVRQPHQVVLQVASELGLVGLALLAAMSVGAGWAAVRAVRRTGGGGAAAAVAVIVAIAVDAQLDIAWSVPAIAVIAAVLAGSLVATATPEGRRPRRAGTVAAAVTPVAAVVLLVSALLPWASLLALDRAAAEVDARQASAAASAADLAAELNPLDIRALIRRANAARLVGDDAERLRAAHDAVGRQPGNPFAVACLVSATAAGTDPVAHERAMARLAELAPANPQGILARAAC